MTTVALVRLRPRDIRTVLDRSGFLVLASLGVALGFGFALTGVRPIDSDIYWSAAQAPSYYGDAWGPGSLFVYPPPLGQILAVLPWSAYIVVWTSLLFAGFWAATREWALPVFVLTTGTALLAGFTHPLANAAALTFIGNPQVLVAAACVVGFRYPAAWAFVLLTKIAPGIGVIWFAVRGEWRSLAVALGTTAGIIVVSFALAPELWFEFLRFAATTTDADSPEPIVPVPFLVRLPMSLTLLVWGARTDRRWTVPIAAGWASIALYEWSALTVWMAALPLVRRVPSRRRCR